jgi:hypothetical protein
MEPVCLSLQNMYTTSGLQGSFLPKINLDNTFGAYLLGTFCSSVLFGVSSLQTFIYYMSYPADRWHLKVMVAFLWMLEAAHTALNMQANYHFLVTNYFNPIALLQIEETSTVGLRLQPRFQIPSPSIALVVRYNRSALAPLAF